MFKMPHFSLLVFLILTFPLAYSQDDLSCRETSDEKVQKILDEKYNFSATDYEKHRKNYNCAKISIVVYFSNEAKISIDKVIAFINLYQKKSIDKDEIGFELIFRLLTIKKYTLT